MAATLVVFCWATLKATSALISPPRAQFILRAEKIDNPNPILEKAVEMAPQFQVGRRVKFGLFSEPVDQATTSPAEQAQRRRRAAETLTNIDDDERDRRRTVGLTLSVASIFAAAALVQAKADFGTRLAIAPLVWFALSYLESARTGL